MPLHRPTQHPMRPTGALVHPRRRQAKEGFDAAAAALTWGCLSAAAASGLSDNRPVGKGGLRRIALGHRTDQTNREEGESR